MNDERKIIEYERIIQLSFESSDFTAHNIEQALNYVRVYTRGLTQKGLWTNLMVIDDDNKIAFDYVRRIIRAIELIEEGDNRKFAMCPIKALRDKQTSMQELSETYQAVVIPDYDYIGDEMDQFIAKQIEDTPNLVKIICISNEQAANKLNGNDHLFFRILNHHIILGKYTEKDALSLLIKKIENAGYSYTQKFRDNITDYINTVYPKADLKDADFVRDLYNRVMNLLLGRAHIIDQVDDDCVPYYKKPEHQIRENTVQIDEGEISDKTSDATDSIKVTDDIISGNEAKENKNIATDGAVDNDGIEFPNEFNKKGDKDNILVVALSTFPRGNEIKESQYEYESGATKISGSYYYQLEPVPRIIAKQLIDKNDTLDKIIILCTKDTKEEVYKEPIGECSPLTYFQKKVSPYMNPGREEEHKFEVIEIDEKNPTSGINSTIESIRKNKGNIYLDTHGGFRGIDLILEAVISLLRAEDIVPEAIYGVQYGDGKATVIDSVSEFKMFDFVSGINAFIRYGRIDPLQSYLKGNAGNSDKLIKIVKNISEAIQLCNVGQFENELKKLSEHFKKNNAPDDEYLKLFHNNIKEDYADLLENPNYLDEIEWCLKKGLYQQCLTILESKAAEFLLQSGILVFGEKLNSSIEYHAEHNRRGNKIRIDEIINNRKIEKNRDIFNQCIEDQSFPYKDIDQNVKNEDNRLEMLAEDCDNFETLTLKTDFKSIQHQYEDQKIETISGTATFVHKDMTALCRFIVLHKTLKGLRNNISHVKSIRSDITTEKVGKALEQYIRIGRDLLPENDNANQQAGEPITEGDFEKLQQHFASKSLSNGVVGAKQETVKK